MAGCGSGGGMGSGGSKDRSPRLSSTRAERLAQSQCDASQSGVVPLMGFGMLAFIVAAIVRLIF